MILITLLAESCYNPYTRSFVGDGDSSVRADGRGLCSCTDKTKYFDTTTNSCQPCNVENTLSVVTSFNPFACACSNNKIFKHKTGECVSTTSITFFAGVV